ncbi:MAG TPA: hypothetical protein VJU61_22050 [Polyangiaceae bacterium]|nr:hypothetical protein [Polyangiaceae bacterium]
MHPEPAGCARGRHSWRAMLGLLLALGCAQILGTDQIEIIGAPPPGPGGPPPTACAASELRCVGASLQICREDLSGFRTARVCSTPQLCCSDPNRCPSGPTCLAPSCAPGDFRCDGRTLNICNEEQTGWTPISTCSSAAQCNASLGRCTDQPCSPTVPDRQCSGGDLLSCASSSWAPLGACETQALCSAEPSNYGCTETRCLVGDNTLPSPFRCANGDLQRCNDEQTGFEFVETCLNALHCNGLMGEVGDAQGVNLDTEDLRVLGCSLPGCTPGHFSCDREGRLLLCDQNRSSYRVLVEDCGSASRCNASTGTCSSEDCTPGVQQCNGNQLQTCTQQRAWQTTDTCASAAQCDLGGCQPPECQIADYRCRGAALERCNVARTGWIAIHSCDSAALCNAEAKRCDAPVCQPGQRRCSRDGKLEECAPGQNAWATLSDCRQLAGLPETATPEQLSGLCDSSGARCLTSASCTSGTLRCNGEFLERCQNNSWQPQARCNTPSACDASGAGSCRTTECVPGAHRCVIPGAETIVAEPGDPVQGLTLQECNAAGSGYATVQECPGYCDAAHGQCDICNSLDLLCFNARLYRCSADGQERELEKPCRMGCTERTNSGVVDAGTDAGVGSGPGRPTCIEDLGKVSQGND